MRSRFADGESGDDDGMGFASGRGVKASSRPARGMDDGDEDGDGRMDEMAPYDGDGDEDAPYEGYEGDDAPQAALATADDLPDFASGEMPDFAAGGMPEENSLKEILNNGEQQKKEVQEAWEKQCLDEYLGEAKGIEYIWRLFISLEPSLFTAGMIGLFNFVVFRSMAYFFLGDVIDRERGGWLGRPYIRTEDISRENTIYAILIALAVTAIVEFIHWNVRKSITCKKMPEGFEEEYLNSEDEPEDEDDEEWDERR